MSVGELWLLEGGKGTGRSLLDCSEYITFPTSYTAMELLIRHRSKNKIKPRNKV